MVHAYRRHLTIMPVGILVARQAALGSKTVFTAYHAVRARLATRSLPQLGDMGYPHLVLFGAATLWFASSLVTFRSASCPARGLRSTCQRPFYCIFQYLPHWLSSTRGPCLRLISPSLPSRLSLWRPPLPPSSSCLQDAHSAARNPNRFPLLRNAHDSAYLFLAIGKSFVTGSPGKHRASDSAHRG